MSDDGTPIYVHAKIMVIDDCLLKVGSSNLNNRSMGLDTECDLAIEAPPANRGGKAMRDAIRTFMHGLLAEHLDADPSEIASARRGSDGDLIPVIEHLLEKSGSGLTLSCLEPQQLSDTERLLVEKRILDPERPGPMLPQLKRLLDRNVWPGTFGKSTK